MPCVCDQQEGLRGEYFTDHTSYSLFHPDKLRQIRYDSTVNFNWGDKKPLSNVSEYNFQIRWGGILDDLDASDGRGYIYLPHTGTWTFYTETERRDCVRLWVDGTGIIDDWITPCGTGAETNTGTINISTPGWYTIQLNFYDTRYEAAIRLEYEGPPGSGVSRQVIPASALRTCNADSSTPSCTVDLSPATASIAIGSDITYFSTVTIGSGTVDQVNFSSSNTSVATVNPASDASSPYQTIATGVSAGGSTTTSDVVMSGAVRCTDTASLDVTTPDPWWQVKDADIIANGNIISSIPLSCALPDCDPVLGLEGLGGFPGVPSYLGSASFGEGSVSSKGWLAESETKFKKVYDYDFFDRLVRTDVIITEISEPEVNGGFFTSGGTPSRGYVWYHFDGSSVPPGDLTINSNVNMPGDRKVILLIEGADLYIDGRINIVDGRGFFMVIVGKNEGGNKGNIYVKDDLPGQDEIEGVFLAEGQFKTGAGDNQLYVRGMVAAYDGVVLERDLTDNSTEPAELFEYAPDMVLTFPRDLTYKRLRWKEVAP
ncbi:MAG: hypothetical protein WBD86_00305 [Microgenomates group bacterium]